MDVEAGFFTYLTMWHPTASMCGSRVEKSNTLCMKENCVMRSHTTNILPKEAAYMVEMPPSGHHVSLVFEKHGFLRPLDIHHQLSVWSPVRLILSNDGLP